MATPEKCIFVFATKLGCKKDIGSPLPRTIGKSQLPCFFEHESSRCTLPSLSLGKSTDSCDQKDELKAVLELNKQTISVAPVIILKHVSTSFGTMIDNRIKQFQRLLVANSHKNHKVDELNQKISSLVFSEKSSPACFTSAESSFRTLSMNKGFVKTVGRLKAVILPLVFKTTIHINILGVKDVKVCIIAPGTITGTFFGSCCRLRSADIAIDTDTVYQCMKARCDQVVGEAFELAALLSSVQSSNGYVEKPKQSTGLTKRPIPGFFCSPIQSLSSSNSASNIHISPL